jgi:hypothetical protein
MKTISIVKKHLVLLAALAIVSITYAQTGGDYQIVWSTIDGGGGTTAGGQYNLTSTIGQPDAEYSSGSKYELLGGFWPGGPLCFVEFADLAVFVQYWLENEAGLPADLDGNGRVDFYDFRFFADEWLCTCPYNWPL